MTRTRKLPAALIDNAREQVRLRNDACRAIRNGAGNPRVLAHEVESRNDWLVRNAEAVGISLAELLELTEML